MPHSGSSAIGRIGPFLLCLAVLCACSRVDPAIRAIDSEIRVLRAAQDGLLALALDVDASFPYPYGTEIIVRSDASGPRKIEVSALGELGRTEEDFFFRDGELLYCERRVWRGERSEDAAGRREAKGYYFKDGKLIGAIDPWNGKRSHASVQLGLEGPPLLERASFLYAAALRAGQGQ